MIRHLWLNWVLTIYAAAVSTYALLVILDWVEVPGTK